MPRITCAQCNKPQGYCYCDRLIAHDNQRPVWIFQHPNEVTHAIGTGRIAHLSLQNSELIIGRRVSECDGFAEQLMHHQPLLVFPSEHSVALNEVLASETIDPSRPLLFLDATWRKAKRMVYESPELSALTHVHVLSHERPRYKIRKASPLRQSLTDPAVHAGDEGSNNDTKIDAPTAQPLSTLEAIVHSLRGLEGDPCAYQSMLDAMDWVIQRQIDAMGHDVYEKNYQNGPKTPTEGD